MDESFQPGGQAKGRPQARGKRTVDLCIGIIDRIRAAAATVVLVRVKTVSDFLEGHVNKFDKALETRRNSR